MKSPSVRLSGLLVALIWLVPLAGHAGPLGRGNDEDNRKRQGPIEEEKKPEVPHVDPVIEWIAAKDEAEQRVQKAEFQRAKLLFMEKQKKGVVLAYAIPQPQPADIRRFMAPLRRFIASTKDDRCRGWAKKRIALLERVYGFEAGRFRAVYVLIPENKEDTVDTASFPAESQAECEKFIRDDLKPVKLEIGKPYQARAGVRDGTKEIMPGWRGEQLVRDRGLDASLENWIGWHRKRGLPR